ncbi:hypothetical protein Misp02_68980 [Microtetraspora sp. NBRC 16547]|nr:hypothetical protein Misp02_68980 [Microtetraspora sp. NBRC 16547]
MGVVSLVSVSGVFPGFRRRRWRTASVTTVTDKAMPSPSGRRLEGVPLERHAADETQHGGVDGPRDRRDRVERRERAHREAPAPAEIRRVAPDTGVVILTTFGEDEYIARDRRGRRWLPAQGRRPRELIAGVHAVAGGGAYLSPPVAYRVITELGGGRSAIVAYEADLVAEG